MTRARSFLAISAAVTLCLVAAGCVRGSETDASLEHTIAPSAIPASGSEAMALAEPRIPHDRPLAHLPPEAGRVTNVRAHDYVDGLRQDILLDGGALKGVRNSITVLARTSTRQSLEEMVPLFKPTEAGIRSEMGAQFPRVAMQVVDRDSHNDYGPYGLALGRAGGDVRCLYMWQWIDANRLPPSSGVQGPVSVRVRLCQAATTFDAMAALVDHLTIGGDAPVEIAAGEVISAPVDAATSKPKPRKSHRARHVPTAPPVQQAAILAAPAVPAAPVTPLASDLPAQALLGPKASR